MATLQKPKPSSGASKVATRTTEEQINDALDELQNIGQGLKPKIDGFITVTKSYAQKFVETIDSEITSIDTWKATKLKEIKNLEAELQKKSGLDEDAQKKLEKYEAEIKEIQDAIPEDEASQDPDVIKRVKSIVAIVDEKKRELETQKKTFEERNKDMLEKLNDAKIQIATLKTDKQTISEKNDDTLQSILSKIKAVKDTMNLEEIKEDEMKTFFDSANTSIVTKLKSIRSTD
jgi:chromosome segregation ATPase